jgi:hypothetical protein
MSSYARTTFPQSIDCISTQESWSSQLRSPPADEDLASLKDAPSGLYCVNDTRRHLYLEARASIPADQFITLHWSWSCSPSLADTYTRAENPPYGCYNASDAAAGAAIDLNKSSVQLYFPPEPSSSYEDRLNEAYSNGTLLTYLWSLVTTPISLDINSPVLVQRQFYPRNFLIPLGPFPAKQHHMKTRRRSSIPSKRVSVVDITTNDTTVKVYRPSLVCFIFEVFQLIIARIYSFHPCVLCIPVTPAP